MIIPVKKTLNNAGHIDAKLLIDFSEICHKNPTKLAVFIRLFLGEVSPQNFPWNRPILSEFWLFSREIGRFFREFAPEIPAKSCFFSAKYRKPCVNNE